MIRRSREFRVHSPVIVKRINHLRRAAPPPPPPPPPRPRAPPPRARTPRSGAGARKGLRTPVTSGATLCEARQAKPGRRAGGPERVSRHGCRVARSRDWLLSFAEVCAREELGGEEILPGRRPSGLPGSVRVLRSEER